MYGFDFEDLARIVLKGFIISFFVVSLLIGSYYLININFNIAYNISDTLKIPRDLSLTVMSAGFANNVMILLTFFEFGSAIWIYSKIANTKLCELREIITNL